MEFALLFVHILAGGTALAAGFLALYSQKGQALHRRSGRIFSHAMLAMTVFAAILALSYRPNRVNVVVACLTFYLVATGLLTVLKTPRQAPRLHDALFGFGFFASVAAWGLGVHGLGLPNRVLDHVPAAMIFMFATIGSLGVLGDARLLRSGAIEGTARLRRHLWRMGVAFWIAVLSFFFGQARQLPPWFRAAKLNDAVVLLVLATLVYWLLKLRPRRRPASAQPSIGSAAAAAAASRPGA
jgi:hypothetical protein